MSPPVALRRPRRLDLALLALLAASAAVAAAAALAGAARALDALGQFAPPALAAALLAAAAALIGRRLKIALALLAVGLGLAVELRAQWIEPQAPPAPGTRPVRVYFDNLWPRNDHGAEIRRSIGSADADVVALVQVSERNAGFVRQSLAAYPFRLEAFHAFGRSGPARTVIASRFPIRAVASAFVGDFQPGYAVEIGAPRPFRLVVVHLQRPWPYRGQPEQLAALQRDLDLGGARDRTVMVGDFNSTLSSAALSRFRREASLNALAAPLGDWPAFLPAPFRLPLENVLSGRAVSVLGRRFAPPNGSDHRPIVFTVAPAA